MDDDEVENEGKSGKKNTIIVIIKSVVVYRVKHFRQTKKKNKARKRYALCSS